MNDNHIIEPTSVSHAQALALVADLQVILSHAARRGCDVRDDNGELVFDFDFWARECQMVLIGSGVTGAASQ